MTQDRRTATVLLLAVAAVTTAAAASALGGCTGEQYAYLKRQTSYPSDYKPTPLGPSYDALAEVEKLRDERLRNTMQEWLKLRDEYVRQWREKGDHDALVGRIRNRMDFLKAYIQDLATQLLAMNEPLS